MSAAHSARELPEVIVESDNLELKEDDEFVGEHGAIEDFAQELAEVIRRFMRMKVWQGTEGIVIGGSNSCEIPS
ncbi:MAG: hypothetical protein ACLP8A_17235 [Methylovirgula sp.]